MNYKRNNWYFQPKTGLIVFGCTLLFMGIIILMFSFFYGTLFLIGALAIFFLTSLGIKLDELDRSCEELVNNMKEEAFSYFGIDEEQVNEAPAMIVSGYEFGEDFDEDIGQIVFCKKGEGGVWRSSQYKVSVLLFSREQIYFFSRSFSIVKKGDVQQYTDEFFYRDIVSVTVMKEKTLVPKNMSLMMAKLDPRVKVEKTAVSYDVLKITTTGGTTIKAVIKNSAEFDRSFNAMRNLLRDKKQIMA
ncbi:MAG: hypothetical protein FWG90_08045 [Oscillospiraceae bacterium]|nr:hypothetical protein [Oscillospiraceae bacterium]